MVTSEPFHNLSQSTPCLLLIHYELSDEPVSIFLGPDFGERKEVKVLYGACN